jgi:hypothetical protein
MVDVAKKKRIKPEDLVATALRNYAYKLINDGTRANEKEARALDRALRCCAGISDIDVVWVMWSFWGEKYNWLTGSEMTYNTKNGRHEYLESGNVDDE